MFGFKNIKNSDANQECPCQTTQGLFMHSRQVSLIVASLLLLSFFLFMGGYFLGQKNAVRAFSNKIDQESFGDQIYSSMCSLCDNGDVEDGDSQDGENDGTDSGAQTQAIKQDVDQEAVVAPEIQPEIQTDVVAVNQVEKLNNESQESNDIEDQDAQSAQYFAQLAGFGTARAAHLFAQKLARKEVSVVVKERQSRSARGKFVSWYQVVTEKFEDKDELKKLVARLQSEEKLKGVNIVTC
ncbi:MAG: hypothetical protein P4L31_03405 [Candidatus Babeliales bacterium]|nr:hypothetical protein [Candidatus Babeliales bacterium]